MDGNVYERLDALQRIGIKLGLRNIKVLLEKLGHPESTFSSVLIAGTNGKGSVGAMLEAMLRAQGFRTGHYISPHLVDLCERIRIQGHKIDSAGMEATLRSVFDAADACVRESLLDTPPTYFETLTAAAFCHFRAAGVNFAIVEVGLGGRFDATNVLTPNLSVITNIDFDHLEYLGHSRAEIATEKAGIVKASVPLVTGLISAEALPVILHAAAGQGCDVTSLREDMIREATLENGFPVFTFAPWNARVRPGLRGMHQCVNAGTALLCVDALRRSGFALENEASLQALQSVRWPGRLDLISEQPPVLLDCAHNPAGVESLSRFLEQHGWERVVVLFSAMRDKNIAAMINRIAPRVESVVLTRVEPADRCARYEELAGACLAHHLPFAFREDCAAAFQLARESAAQRQLPLVVFGSIYLIGEIYRITGAPLD